MATPSRGIRIGRCPFQVCIFGLGRVLRLALAALICATLTGCGAGALIGGAVVGVVIGLKDDGSSGPDLVPEVLFVTGPSSRQETRDRNNATTIPLEIGISFDGLSEVTVQYALVDSEDEWQTATRAPESECTPPSELSGQVWCWNAEADLGPDLNTASQRVKVRAFFRDDEDRAKQSPRSFLVGNSVPEVFFTATVPSEPGGNEPIEISFEVRDAEGDPLIGRDPTRGPQLMYEVEKEGVPSLVCVASPAAAGDCEHACSPSDPIGDVLPVGRKTFFWWSRCVEEIGQRNLDVKVTLHAKDHFGNSPDVPVPLSLSVRNNRPPEVDIFTNSGGRDQSFEIPILYNLFEEDCADPQDLDCAELQSVDIIVQYDPEGGRDFPPLDERFDRHDFRRQVLDPASIEFAKFSQLRRELRIATPHASRSATGQVCDLTASRSGVQHTFLWDSAEDILFSSLGTVTVKITPYDEERGLPSVAPLLVENDFYPSPKRIPVLENRQSVGGIAFGDLDGDGRDDQVYSLTAEGELMICLSAQAGGARVGQGCEVLRLRERPSSPAVLKIADLDGDGLQDLVVLNRKCSIGACRSRGAIEIYFGTPGGENGLGIESKPAEPLDTGRDARSICVGDFDGTGGLDIAVSNRDDRTVGIYLSSGARSYTSMIDRSLEVVGNERPGSMTRADFDGDDLDEFAVRLREAGLVNVYEWDHAAQRIAEVSSTEVTSPGSLDTADFDGDGWIDLAVGSRDPPFIHLLRNRGGDSPGQSPSISFTRVCPDLDLEGRAELLAVARLAAEEADEYLLASAGDDTTNLVELVRLRFSDGNCAEFTPLKRLTFAQPSSASNLRGSVAVRDFDGDGLVDVFVGGRDGALFLRAEGPGSLAEGPLEELALPGVDALAFADLSCNSLADIAVVNRLRTDDDGHTFYEASLFPQDPLTGFQQSAAWVSDRQPALELEVFISTGDRDDNGCPDVLAVSRKEGIDFFLREESAFSADFSPSPRSIELTSSFAVPFALGLFGGGDGLNVLTLDRESGVLALRTLTFPEGEEPHEIDERVHGEFIPTGSRSFRLLTGDIEGNGLLDLVVTHKDLDRNREVLLVLRQVPDEPWPRNFVEEPAPVLPEALLLGIGDTALLLDVNSDGRGDLVFAGPGKPLGVFLSTGEPGSLFPQPSVPAPVLPAELAGARIDTVTLADLSNDARPDLVMASRSGQDAVLSILYGRQDGTFPSSASRTILVPRFGAGRVRVGVTDLTSDSRPEIVVFGALANATWIGRSR